MTSLRSSAGLAWLFTALATVLAAATRLTNLGRVPDLIFDEVYYVKDAWSLAQLGYEGTWGDTFPAGLDPSASFVVHPPVGKWLISLGMQWLGPENPVGWRLVPALMGVLGVFFLCRWAWLLFRSPAVVGLAGLFLATDGMHLVLSRTALLDGILTTFVLGALWALTHDQLGPATGWRRPWLVVTGLFLGLAVGTKWSGLYVAAALGLFVVARELVLGRRTRAVWPDGVAAFGSMIGTAALVYLVSWTSWFTHPAAWGHTGGNALSDWWRYQRQVFNFHAGLATPHPYQSHPAGWLLQLRPTSFWYQAGDQTILALGNPLLWWFGVAALLAFAVAALWRRTWPYALVLVGWASAYLPWFLYPDRTVFTFYTVVLSPFVALMSAWAVAELGRRVSRVLAGVLVVAILASAWFFWPIWTGAPLGPGGFMARMWLRSWI
ncbi:phospholipid carrier-dependent glycosyltransferase [Actinomyces sp. F1_1611]